MSEERLDWLDALKGIGIIFVILGHTQVGFRTYLFSFHIPLFFFASGYLFRPESSGSLGVFFAKITRRILIPYVFFGFLSLLLASLVANTQPNLLMVRELVVSTRNHITVNPTLWYLTCLFVVELLFYAIARLVKNSYMRIALVVALSLLGFAKYETSALPFSADAAPYFMLFYMIGNLFRTVEPSKALRTVAGFSAVPMTVLIMRPDLYAHAIALVADSLILSYLTWVLFALLGIAACYGLSLVLQRSGALKTIGRNSLVFFALHIFVLQAFMYLLVSLGIKPNEGYNVFGLTATLACLLLMRPIADFLSTHFGFLLGRSYGADGMPAVGGARPAGIALIAREGIPVPTEDYAYQDERVAGNES